MTMSVEEYNLGRGYLDNTIMALARKYGFKAAQWRESDVSIIHNLDELNAAYDKWVATGERIPMYNGYSDHTIYSNRRKNLAFRCWHDQVHVTLQANFAEDEREVIERQAYQLREHAAYTGATHREAELASKVLVAEVLAQVEHQDAHHGAFPNYQERFIFAYLVQGAEVALATEW